MKRKKLLGLLFFIILLFFAGTVIADTNNNEESILYVNWPDSPAGTSIADDTNLQEFVRYLYEWGITIGILIVFGVMVYAGFQYTVSAGDPGLMKDAMSRIQSAGIGLILLLSSWLILHTINPELTKMETLDPQEIYLEVSTKYSEELIPDDPPCSKVILFNEPYFGRGKENKRIDTGKEGRCVLFKLTTDDEMRIVYEDGDSRIWDARPPISHSVGNLPCGERTDISMEMTDILSAMPIYTPDTEEIEGKTEEECDEAGFVWVPPRPGDPGRCHKELAPGKVSIVNIDGKRYYETSNCSLDFYHGGTLWNRCNELIPPVINSPISRIVLDKTVKCMILTRGAEEEEIEVDTYEPPEDPEDIEKWHDIDITPGI